MPKPSDWIYFADEDLIAAKALLELDISLGAVFYHCQQSAEKALKGYLSFQNQPIKKTHDLRNLVDLCKEFDDEFGKLIIYADDLRPFDTVTRYPDDYYIIPDTTTAQICTEKAEKILEFVKLKIQTN